MLCIEKMNICMLRMWRSFSFIYNFPHIRVDFIMFGANSNINDLKGLTTWLSFVMSNCESVLFHWYPELGVVLNCIVS